MSTTDRYARQTQFAPLGETGQQRLAASRVLVLGVGALGTVAAELLVRAGVGFVRLVDRDIVEWNNLQRQALFDEQDARQQAPKAPAAASRLQQINGDVQIEAIVEDFVPDNAVRLVADVDLVIDATDNFPTRLLLNDVSVKRRLPWVHGGCVGAGGQVTLFTGEGTPCFRCLVPSPPSPGSVATCDTAGVLNTATHTIASLQATEAIRWFATGESAWSKRMLSIDLWTARWRVVDLHGFDTSTCPACSSGQFDYLDGGAVTMPLALCGRSAVQIPAPVGGCPDFDSLARRWQDVGEVSRTRFVLRLNLGDREVSLFPDGRAVIAGTTDVTEARAIYARYVGC